MAPMRVIIPKKQASKDQAANVRTEAIPELTLEMVPRNCRLEPYTKIKGIKPYNISGEIIAYASPDSTYAVTRRLLNAATKSILIGIYDFDAKYIESLLLAAMARGVKVSLMLDLDRRNSETAVYDELTRMGAETVPAPSCASEHAHYFPNSHEKVIVIDGAWVLVQSGNYSKNSIPFNEKDGGDPSNFVTGNRDMGVAINSKSLAKFFTNVLRSDMKLELDAMQPEALSSRTTEEEPMLLVEAAPRKMPVKLFTSKSFNPDQAIKVTPILSPDNYMPLIPNWIATASTSILIQQQYIRAKEPTVRPLLEAISDAMKRNPALEVKIILGKLFEAADYDKELANLQILKDDFGLNLGEHIRYIDEKRFVHCHNKTVIVDQQSVLVSSQNWSRTGIGTNREAGVLLESPEIAEYFATIIETDWTTSLEKPKKPGAGTISPESLSEGGFVRVNFSDYREV
jgi:phosphatidylserine/phosphatidylglycerophosphate/cardiolipin synthase-like enzyme